MSLKEFVVKNQLVVMGGAIVILVNLIGGLIYLNSKPKNNNTIDSRPTIMPDVSPTETVVPTETPEPTATPWPSDTPTPKPTIKLTTSTASQSGGQVTPSPIPTQTPGPTNTLAPVTNTPIPPTQTPAQPTSTPVPPTSTPVTSTIAPTAIPTI